MHAGGAGTAALLKDVRENRTPLIADAKKDLRGFPVAATSSVGPKCARTRA